MDFGQPFRTVTPTLDGPVLRVLARITHPLTRREISQLVADASEAGVRKVLKRLTHQGIVIEQQIGSQFAYAVNREHLAWPAVELIATSSQRFDDRLRAYVETWSIKAISVELFGSVADGSATADSDVDLMIYRPHLDEDGFAMWDQQVADLRLAVERWTGNRCEILQLDAPTLVTMVANEERVLRAPRVPISGADLKAAMPSPVIARQLSGPRTASQLKKIMKVAQHSPALLRTVEELGKY
jgi:Fe2+ or Zn2+ uptake regulation protein